MEVRIKGVPLDWDREALALFLASHSDGDRLSPKERWSLAPEIQDNSQTATFSSTRPLSLNGPVSSHLSNLSMDTDFLGVTTLYRPDPTAHEVDLNAISGLGGHAFGSFKERKGTHMWLRDALPHNLERKNTRVIIYGYDSKVANSDSFQTLQDIAWTFRESLLPLTRSDSLRPIVFVGHSLGGLVVKQSVRTKGVQMLVLLSKSAHTEDKLLLRLVSGLIFFGVPHQGMDIGSLVPMVGDGPNKPLIELLDCLNTHRLDKLQRDFVNGACCTNVFVFYETKVSPTAEQQDDGTWKMSGPSVVLVDQASATRCLEVFDNARMCAVNETHSNMVKFKPHDHIYGLVLPQIQKMVEGAVEIGKKDAAFAEARDKAFPHDTPEFVGRREELDTISNIFWPTSDLTVQALMPRVPIQPMSIVVYGPTGIGKTRFVLQYAAENLMRYDDFFFMSASNAIDFRRDRDRLQECATMEGLSTWLRERGSRRRWLLIIDHVVEETSNEARTIARASFGQGTFGHVLFTTDDHILAKEKLGRNNRSHWTA